MEKRWGPDTDPNCTTTSEGDRVISSTTWVPSAVSSTSPSRTRARGAKASVPYYPTTWEVAIPKTDDNEARVLIARGWAERGGATVEQRDNGNLIVLTLSMEIDGKAKVGRYDAELRRMTSELFEGAGVNRW